MKNIKDIVYTYSEHGENITSVEVNYVDNTTEQITTPSIKQLVEFENQLLKQMKHDVNI